MPNLVVLRFEALRNRPIRSNSDLPGSVEPTRVAGTWTLWLYMAAGAATAGGLLVLSIAMVLVTVAARLIYAQQVYRALTYRLHSDCFEKLTRGMNRVSLTSTFNDFPTLENARPGIDLRLTNASQMIEQAFSSMSVTAIEIASDMTQPSLLK